MALAVDLPQPSTPVRPRLRSLDALRGFDMYWIIGGDAFLDELSKLTHNDAIRGVCMQFIDHMPWAGFRYYDMIFPLFLFIIGTTLPFSVGCRLEEGESRKSLVRKILIRAAILWAFGMIYNGALTAPSWDHVRIVGVLQRQGFGYACAGLIYLYCKPKAQIWIGIGILLGYWALMAFGPVPGVPHGTYTEWGNFANYIDRQIFAPHQMYEKYGDPEGPVSMIPAIATALIGLLAGQWLRSSRPEEKKSLGLLVAGLACLALGLAWSPLFPIIKKIWTSSYVLFAGGMSLLLLAGFHWIIDVKGWWKWSFPFIVIGMNPISIYMLTAVVDFTSIATHFVGGVANRLPDEKQAILAGSTLLVEWLLLYFLYKRKIFLKI
jgi:predicted acyltransferase